MTTSGIANPLHEWQQNHPDYYTGVTRTTLSDLHRVLEQRRNQPSASSAETDDRQASERTSSLIAAIDVAYKRRKREERLAKLPFNAYTSL